MKINLKSKNGKHGSVATGFTVVVLAVVLVLNLFVGVLSRHKSLSLDLTRDHSYALSDQTTAYLEKLDRDVIVSVLDREDAFSEHFRQPYELLKKYALATDHLTLEFLDVVRDPGFLAEHDPDLKLSSGDVVVSCGSKLQVIKPYDLYLIEQTPYGMAATETRAEKAITGALMTVCSDISTKVVLLTGHGEVAADGFQRLLQDNGCQLYSVNPITEEIPADAQIAILAAPEHDLDAAVLEKLDRFLDHDGQLGRTLLYLANPTVRPSNLPGISGFLADWGVQINDAMVAEASEDRYFEYNPLNAIVGYTDEGIARFMDTSYFCTVPNGLEMECLFEQSIEGRMTSTLLSYTDTAYAVPLDRREELQEEFTPVQKARPAVIRTVQPGREAVSQVLTVASVSAVADPIIAASSLANGEFFAGLLNSLVGREDTLIIEAKKLDRQELVLTASQGYTMMAIYIVIVPLAVLALGIISWLRNKRL